MTSKKLTFRQIRWTEILSKFNIKIQFQSKIQNVKIDVLIRMSNFRFKNENDERHQYRKQMLLTFDKFEIHVVKSNEFIYERIFVVNKIDDQCQMYRETFNQNLISIKNVNLKQCHEKNEILYYDDKLWIFVDMFLLIDFFKKIHEFSISNHFEFNRMKNFLRRDYYWSNMRKIIRQYVRNCHECQRIKVFKNRKNEFLIFLIIFLQRWIDISMNFITELFNAHNYNVICTIIDRLNKKRHYVFCTIDDENINVEIIVRIFIQYVFRIHDLFFLLRQIEIFNLYFSFDKHFAEFSISNVNFSSFFIQKSTIKSKKSIKISKNNCDNIAITCKTIEIFEYSWSNSRTTMSFRQSSNYHRFSWTRTFIFAWTFRSILFFTHRRKNDYWSSKLKISSTSCKIFSITYETTLKWFKSVWRFKSTNIERQSNTSKTITFFSINETSKLSNRQINSMTRNLIFTRCYNVWIMFIVSNYSRSCAFMTFFIVDFYERILVIFLKIKSTNLSISSSWTRISNEK